MSDADENLRIEWTRLTDWGEPWALAVVFGMVSVPWTYGFVAGLDLPLWPAFIASATYFAVGHGPQALVRGYASNLIGAGYGAATLAIVDGFLGGGALALSLVVGGFMLLASLHAAVPLLSFTPGGFLGYATLFGVHAADVTIYGIGDIRGALVGTAIAMLIGAVIGLFADVTSSVIE